MSIAMRSEATISGSGSASGGKEGFFVAAVSEAGELYAWRCAPVGDDGHRIEAALLARISVGATRSANYEWHVIADHPAQGGSLLWHLYVQFHNAFRSTHVQLLRPACICSLLCLLAEHALGGTAPCLQRGARRR